MVIEDAVAGVTAAKRAGMHCLAVTTTHPRQSLGEADLIVDSLETITVDDLKEISMEKSLVLIKPDALQRGLSGTIINRLEKLGLKIVALKMIHLDKALAQRHYAVHSDKPFFDSLVAYISSAPIIAIIFEGKNTIEVARKAMGATDPGKADAGTIRGDFGLDIEHNAIHGSDSAETARTEIKLFFSGDEIFNYDREIDSQVTGA